MIPEQKHRKDERRQTRDCIRVSVFPEEGLVRKDRPATRFFLVEGKSQCRTCCVYKYFQVTRGVLGSFKHNESCRIRRMSDPRTQTATTRCSPGDGPLEILRHSADGIASQVTFGERFQGSHEIHHLERNEQALMNTTRT